MVSYIASAPGKVVLWGEYAVLVGTPAIVQAVDVQAKVVVQPTSESKVTQTTQGFASEPQTSRWSALRTKAPEGAFAVLAASLSAFSNDPPSGANVAIDTAEFYHHNEKLGVGSSAACVVAAIGALAEWLDEGWSLTQAITAHRAMQGGKGSGLDVATAAIGGSVKFVDGGATAYPLPADLHVQYYYTGSAASTTSHLNTFQQWLETGTTQPIDRLCAASEALSGNPTNPDAWQNYGQALHGLDNAADLGIYSPAHARLEQLAEQHGLFYKPCGAGGGDVGAAFGFNAHAATALASFDRAVAKAGFQPLTMQGTPNGLQVEVRQ